MLYCSLSHQSGPNGLDKEAYDSAAKGSRCHIWRQVFESYHITNRIRLKSAKISHLKAFSSLPEFGVIYISIYLVIQRERAGVLDSLGLRYYFRDVYIYTLDP